MVCARCIKGVTGIFTAAGIPLKNIKLGEADTINELDDQQ